MKQIKILVCTIIAITAISCTRRMPQIITQEKTVRHVDTIVVQSLKYDTIPCADFDYSMLNEFKDTVYVKVVDKQISVKYLKHSDTIYKETIIVQPAPLRQVTKIDNSIHNKAKKGSAIGDGNKIDNRKSNKFWLGVLVAFGTLYCLNITLELIKKYFPISIPFITIFQKFLP